MRFIVDECTGPAVAQWIRDQGHEVFSLYANERGMDDDILIQKAFSENWILITNDKDFGEKVYREHRPHQGVILLRLDDERVPNKIATLDRLIHAYGNRLTGHFVVASEKQVRFARR